MWTEIGRNGLTEERYTALQFDGLMNVLRRLQMLPGEPHPFSPRVVGPRHWTVYAERSLVEYISSNPGINAERKPHGYAWHQLLVQMADDPDYVR